MPQTKARSLPEELTPEALLAREKQPKAPRKETTENAYAKTAKKWWPLFLTAASWDANDKSCFLYEDGSPRDGIFQQLFIWLFEQDPGAPTPLAKVTGMIVTARVRLRVTVGCEAPPP